MTHPAYSIVPGRANRGTGRLVLSGEPPVRSHEFVVVRILASFAGVVGMSVEVDGNLRALTVGGYTVVVDGVHFEFVGRVDSFQVGDRWLYEPLPMTATATVATRNVP